MAKHNAVGKLGEEIAAAWLKDRGMQLLGRNYRRKWGEIDVISRGTECVHFVEVKTVSYETKEELDTSVSRETWRPEENVHDLKFRRLGRAIEAWIIEHNYAGKWQIDILTVRIVLNEKYARIACIENVILE